MIRPTWDEATTISTVSRTSSEPDMKPSSRIFSKMRYWACKNNAKHGRQWTSGVWKHHLKINNQGLMYTPSIEPQGCQQWWPYAPVGDCFGSRLACLAPEELSSQMRCWILWCYECAGPSYRWWRPRHCLGCTSKLFPVKQKRRCNNPVY